jgi:hypothetical protein
VTPVDTIPLSHRIWSLLYTHFIWTPPTPFNVGIFHFAWFLASAALMRSLLCWDVTHFDRWVVTDVSGQPFCPIFKDQAVWLLKLGPIVCPKTLVTANQLYIRSQRSLSLCFWPSFLSNILLSFHYVFHIVYYIFLISFSPATYSWITAICWIKYLSWNCM